MNDLEQLNARIARLEQQQAELPNKILTEVKKLVSMHTHTFGSKVVWEYPPEVLKRALKNLEDKFNKGSTSATFNEEVKSKDQVIIKMEKVE